MAERKIQSIGQNGRQRVEVREPRRASSVRIQPTPKRTPIGAPSTRSVAGEGTRRVSSQRDTAPRSGTRVNQAQSGRVSPKPKSTITPKSQTSRAKTQSQSQPKQTPKKTAEASQSETHIWLALFQFFIAGYLFLACMSYLFYWDIDADIAEFSKYLNENVVVVSNWGGGLGAVLSELIIGKWLGIMGVMIPLYFAMWGVRLLKISSLKLRRSMTATLFIALVGSLAFGHFCGADGDVFGSGWGGQSGIYLSEWLSRMIGTEGTSLLIFFLIVAVFYYSSGRFIQRQIQRINISIQNDRARREAARLAMRARIDHLKRQAAQAAQDIENMRTEECHSVRGITSPYGDSSSVKEESNDYIIELEGGRYGYIWGYSDLGEANYCYFDVSSMEHNTVESQSTHIESEKVVKVEEEVNEEFGEYNREVKSESSLTPKPEAVEFTIEPTIHEEVIEQRVEKMVVENLEDATTTSQIAQVVTPTINPAISPAKGTEPGIGFEIEVAQEDEKLSERDITSELYDPTAELPNYRRPELNLMLDHTQRVVVTKEEIAANKDKIIHTLSTFGIKIDSIKATIGPTVTLYEIVPAAGVRISKIKNLEDDIALSLSALGIRIIAPIPGKGTIGIEVPNLNKEIVSMHSVIRSARFQNSDGALPIALGKTIQNETFVFDLAKMPHLLVAGATGQGKSVGLNAIITSLLYKKHPAELKFVLVDPKKVELTLYSKLEKHFLAKMEGEDEAIITDTQKVVYTLNSLCKEMDSRYDLLKMAQVRNISEYNDKFTHRRLNPEKGHRYLPYFVVIIDEFADLIMTAGREIETPIARIAQLARAVGIHLIIATQRPTTNIITGVIKANFPARIAFRVTSMIDSRTILDSPGANQLIGRGDMLVSTGSETTRVQCAFIDTPEVDEITKYIYGQRGYVSAYELPEFVPESDQSSAREVDLGRKDSLFNDVARYVVQAQSGSASTIQRKFSIGFNRAGRIIDQLEAAGIVGAQSGSKPRQVLIQDMSSLEMMLDD